MRRIIGSGEATNPSAAANSGIGTDIDDRLSIPYFTQSATDDRLAVNEVADGDGDMSEGANTCTKDQYC